MIDPTALLGPARRGVIVTASDAGLCFGVNEGIARASAAGSIGGASLLVVAPFARDAVARLADVPLGAQLALSCEHDALDLRPLVDAPSLHGGRGGLPTSALDAAEHADPDEVRREFRAQLAKARALGVTPVFLASHDDVVARHLALFDAFLDLAEESQLPIRHGYDFGPIALDAAALARSRGHFVAAATRNWTPGAGPLDDVLADLPDGLSEIIVSPARDGEELRATVADAEARVATLAALSRESVAAVAARHGVAWITWRALSAAAAVRHAPA